MQFWPYMQNININLEVSAKAGKLVFCYRMLMGKDEIDW
jgi:hypothetical protein